VSETGKGFNNRTSGYNGLNVEYRNSGASPQVINQIIPVHVLPTSVTRLDLSRLFCLFQNIITIAESREMDTDSSLGIDGAMSMARNLKGNKTIQVLNLSCKMLIHYQISFKNIQCMLFFCCCIIIGNAICNPGANAIGRSLADNDSLIELDLSCLFHYHFFLFRFFSLEEIEK